MQGETVGTVEVSYRREMPRSDEGPFLKEERKLIETIAERIASAVTQRRLRAAFEGWAAADAEQRLLKASGALCSTSCATPTPPC